MHSSSQNYENAPSNQNYENAPSNQNYENAPSNSTIQEASNLLFENWQPPQKVRAERIESVEAVPFGTVSINSELVQ